MSLPQMSEAVCETCQSEPTVLKCGLCEQPTCKTCAEVLEEDAFSFLPKIPDHLGKGIYCHPCFVDRVAGDLEAYEETMEAAKQLDIYFKKQGKETRFVRRHARPLVINHCVDREELILRLAFLAVHAGFKCLVDVDVTAQKITNHAYQKSVFKGSAVPANPAPHQLPRSPAVLSNPN